MDQNYYLEELMKRYSILAPQKNDIVTAYQLLEKCYAAGGKLLIAGNGGSAADAEHIVGELMKSFSHPRPLAAEFCDRLVQINAEMGTELADKLQGGLPAIALSGHVSLNTAFANDVAGDMCFAQQIVGYGRSADVLLAISTSGNSRNILYVAVAAKAKGMPVIGLTGKGGGKLAAYADAMIAVSETETYKIQELHLPIYHCLCHMLECHFFS